MRTILVQKVDPRRKIVLRVGIQIHGVLPGALDVINKLPIAATQIQESGLRRDVTGEKLAGQHLPDRIPISYMGVKAAAIDFRQVIRAFGLRSDRVRGL